MSEDDLILQYMEAHGSITPAQAAEQPIGCLALHSAISRLRKRPGIVDIDCQIRSGNGKRWGEYSIVRVAYG